MSEYDIHVTPTLFVLDPRVIHHDVTASMMRHHTVVGNRVAHHDQIHADPRFAEWIDEIEEAYEKSDGSVLLVLDIVWDGNPDGDDWFDAELVRELADDGIPVRFCCPGSNL